jgi:hypothetical protein
MKPISLSLLGGAPQNIVTVISQIARELEQFGGVLKNQSILDRALTVRDLSSIGIVAVGTSNRLYDPKASAIPFQGGQAVSIEGKQYLTLTFTAQNIGTYSLSGGTLPDNAIIIRARYNVTVDFTSAGSLATIAFGVESVDPTGIVEAIAINDPSAPWAIAIHDGIPTEGDSSTYTTKTDVIGRNIIATVGGENLTAGALQLALTYIVRD